MVVKTVQEDIFNTDCKHIAFAINTEGYNDAGFAGKVSREYWDELSDCGKHDLCTVISKKVGDKTFHALVCHSLENGWGNDQAEVIRCCFDNIPAKGEESEPVIAIIFAPILLKLGSNETISEDEPLLLINKPTSSRLTIPKSP